MGFDEKKKHYSSSSVGSMPLVLYIAPLKISVGSNYKSCISQDWKQTASDTNLRGFPMVCKSNLGCIWASGVGLRTLVPTVIITDFVFLRKIIIFQILHAVAMRSYN